MGAVCREDLGVKSLALGWSRYSVRQKPGVQHCVALLKQAAYWGGNPMYASAQHAKRAMLAARLHGTLRSHVFVSLCFAHVVARCGAAQAGFSRDALGCLAMLPLWLSN